MKLEQVEIYEGDTVENQGYVAELLDWLVSILQRFLLNNFYVEDEVVKIDNHFVEDSRLENRGKFMYQEGEYYTRPCKIREYC